MPSKYQPFCLSPHLFHATLTIYNKAPVDVSEMNKFECGRLEERMSPWGHYWGYLPGALFSFSNHHNLSGSRVSLNEVGYPISNALQWFHLSLGTLGSGHQNGTRAICPLTTLIPCESHNHHDISKHHADLTLSNVTPRFISQSTFRMRTMIVCYLLDGKGGGHPVVFIVTGGSISWQ